MAETVTLTLPVYRTPAGRHTCAVDVSAGLFCPLLVEGVRGIGCACYSPHRQTALVGGWIADHADGYTIPVAGCPVAAALPCVVSSPHD